MWYVIWTTTGKEENTREMVNTYVDSSLYTRCVIPYKRKKHYHGGKSEIITQIVFPSYVFVETDRIEDFVQKIAWFPGMNVVLHTDDMYSPIYKHEEYLLTKLLNDHDVIDISEGYMEGDRIHVISGPLQGYEGMIKKVIRRRGVAVLQMTIFNRVTEVKLGLELIS